jgi:transposase
VVKDASLVHPGRQGCIIVQVFGAAQAHYGYVFANARASRLKLLVYDGFGVWCAARRLNTGSFVWPRQAVADMASVTLNSAKINSMR